MKNLFFITGLILTGFFAQAQTDSWKIKLHNKILINTNQEDETKNLKNIKSTDWKKNGYLEIIYTESDRTFWKRSFLFFDEKDNQLLSIDSTTRVKISLSKLRKLFAGKKEINIYTVASPLNPDILVRIRRVHLCTLKLR